MEKKYEYRIVLFENNKQKKMIARARSYENILSRYENLLKKSSKVIFPQNHTNKEKKIITIKHEICLVSNDPNLKEYLGFNDRKLKLKEEGFKINKLENYHVEEKFYTYPEQKQKNYLQIKEDLNNIIGAITCYQINNKIAFETVRDIQYLVVCKNDKDCDALYDIFDKDKELPLMCIGKMNQRTMRRRNKKIMDRFNISYKRFHCNKTKS